MSKVRVYLGEVQTTRKIKKLVLTGEEYWTLQSINSYGIANLWTMLPANFSNQQLGLSSHLSVQTTLIANTETEGFYLTSQNVLYIRINTTRASTVTDFKAYLAQQYAAGTPVCVWYVLATEETAVVNEPLMRIGDYADTLSMEQAGVQIPTANGSTTLDVETTVKPSEVYIKYRGEAVSTLSTLSAEVSSTEATTEEVNPEETEEEENGSEDISLQHEFEAIE